MIGLIESWLKLISLSNWILKPHLIMSWKKHFYLVVLIGKNWTSFNAWEIKIFLSFSLLGLDLWYMKEIYKDLQMLIMMHAVKIQQNIHLGKLFINWMVSMDSIYSHVLLEKNKKSGHCSKKQLSKEWTSIVVLMKTLSWKRKDFKGTLKIYCW